MIKLLVSTKSLAVSAGFLSLVLISCNDSDEAQEGNSVTSESAASVEPKIDPKEKARKELLGDASVAETKEILMKLRRSMGIAIEHIDIVKALSGAEMIKAKANVHITGGDPFDYDKERSMKVYKKYKTQKEDNALHASVVTK